MNVYVVELVVAHEGGYVEAVFSTREKAETYAAKRRVEERLPDCDVTEHAVDAQDEGAPPAT